MGLFKSIGWQLKLGILMGLLVILASIYYIGYTKGINVSKVAIAQYETKVQKLNSKLASTQGKVDVQIITKYKDRISYIDKIQTKTITIVKSSVPEQFRLSKGWIYSYNQSVLGLEIDPILASDSNASSISEMKALADTIIPNNGKYLSTAAKLEVLQNWIIETEKSRGEITNEK